MKTIALVFAGAALIFGLATSVFVPWSTDSVWTVSSQTVNQTPPKCLPGEVMDEKTKKCVKK